MPLPLFAVCALLLVFGIVGVAAPRSIRGAAQSYDVFDLVRGWGIYALALGSLCITVPAQTQPVLIRLLGCTFVASVLWHIEIAARRGWTRHHEQAVALNVMGVMGLLALQTQRTFS